MFAQVNVRLDRLQTFLALLVQREINSPSFPGVFARPRRCASNSEISSGLYPEDNVNFRNTDAFRVLVTSAPGSFDVAGVFIHSILLQTARPANRQPFIANLLPTTRGSVLALSPQAFSIGVELTCAVDVRIRRAVGDAGLRFVTTWLFGTTPSTLFNFGPVDQALARPLSTIVRYRDDDINGVPIPRLCSMGSPLCRLASDLEGPVRTALEAALRQLPSFVSGLGEVLPNRGTPISEAIFVTGQVAGMGAGPLNAAMEQFRYVAQTGWGPPGRGAYNPNTLNRRAIAAWRAYLVDRPLGVIPAMQDLVVEATSTEVARGIQYPMRDSLFESFSTIEFGLWMGLYFARSPWATAADAAAQRTAAEGTLRTFRGDPAATSNWLIGIPQPWRDVVTRLAASRQDTARLVGVDAFDGAAVAIATLERRLFGHLASFFEGRPALTGGDALVSDTLPTMLPPPLSDFGAAFVLTRFPALTVPFTPRQAYEDFRQLHLILTTGNRAPTRVERDAARRMLRDAFSGCPMVLNPLPMFDLGGSTVPAGLDRTPPMPLPSIVPGAEEALTQLLSDPQFSVDRRQDMMLHAYRERLLLSRQRFPSSLDPIALSALESARSAAIQSIDRMAAAPCRANTFLALDDGPEPLTINRVNLLRLIDIMDGGPVFLHRGGDAGLERELARGFRNVSFFEDGGDPVISVEPAAHGVLIRLRFALRLAGITANIDIPGDDLVLVGDTKLAIEIVPVGGNGALALRITFQPDLTFPIGRQPSGVSLVLLSIVFSLMLPAFSSVIFSIALGSVTSGAMNDVAYYGFGVPGLSLILLLGEVFSEHPEYADRLAGALPNISSQIESLLRGLLGSEFTLPEPVIEQGPYRATYTVPNFESGFLRRLDSSLADGLGSLSFSPTLDVASQQARFSLRVPSGLQVFNIANAWPQRGLGLGVLVRSFPIVDTSAGWEVCRLLRESRVVEFPMTDLPPQPPPPLPSSLNITLRADIRILSGAVPTLVGISFDGPAFNELIASGVATVRTFLVATDRVSGRETITAIPPPAADRPLTLSVPPSPHFRLEIQVQAAAWLTAMGVGPSGGVASGEPTRAVLLSSVGRFVADFAQVFEMVVTWAPVLFNLRSPEARELLRRLVVNCTEEQLRRMLVIPVGSLMNPFPMDLFSRDLPSGLVPNPGGLLPSVVARPSRPLPTPGDPRPIVDRPWLFGPPASPVPRLEPILDLALRAARPQPMTPSV
jgi:hypothetical protein